MIEAYKLNKDHKFYKQPRVFIVEPNGYTVAAANCTEPTRYGISIYWMKQEDYLDKIDIYKEKWVHPHLIKKLKKDLEITK